MKESLAQLHTQPFAAEREWEVEGIPVLAAAISLPEPVGAGSALTRRIRRYYQLQCRAFLRYCEHWLLPQAAAEYRAALETSRPLPCFRAELGYRVTYNEGGLWSLYTQSRETGPPAAGFCSAGGIPGIWRRGIRWRSAAFSPPGTDGKKRCCPRRQRKFSARRPPASLNITIPGVRICAAGSTRKTTISPRRASPSSIPCFPSPRRQRECRSLPCPTPLRAPRCLLPSPHRSKPARRFRAGPEVFHFWAEEG